MSEVKSSNRIIWFLALYIGGVVALTALAGLLKALIAYL